MLLIHNESQLVETRCIKQRGWLAVARTALVLLQDSPVMLWAHLAAARGTPHSAGRHENQLLCNVYYVQEPALRAQWSSASAACDDMVPAESAQKHGLHSPQDSKQMKFRAHPVKSARPRVLTSLTKALCPVCKRLDSGSSTPTTVSNDASEGGRTQP